MIRPIMTTTASKWKETGLPCPCGQSSDAYSIDHQGNGFCFRSGCTSPFKKGGNELEQEDASDTSGSVIELKFYPHRGISEKAFKTYNTFVKFKDTHPFEVGFPYPNGAVKVRGFEDKYYHTKGDMKNATLFGKTVCDKGAKRVITVFEGEYDCLAAFDIIGNESACVSVRSATMAKTDCTREYEYINSFEKIVICFDSDAPGQEAAKKVLSLFDFKKTYNLVLDKHKDANAYIQGIDDRKAFYDAWRGVRRYTPDNIISGSSDFKKALEQERESIVSTYPLETLQGMLHGMHRGEVIIIKADEGIGKTSLFRMFENHVFKTTKTPVGILHLEEDNGTTLRGIAAYYDEIPAHIQNSPVNNEEVLEVIKKINGEDDSRIFLRSSFDVEDEDEFIGGIRFLVSGCGCDVVFFDHISWLATGSDDQDERKKLDRISQRLKLLAKELNFCLVMISHVNDDGKTRGSRYITKVANTVIYLKRDKTHEDPEERNKMYFFIEKARLIGAKTGPAGYAVYDEDLCLLKDPYNGRA